MSRISALYHIVFSTKDRKTTIVMEHRKDMFMCILEECNKLNCKLVRINAMPDHVHMLVDLHPSISLSDFLRDVKARSSFILHRDERFPDFKGWGGEYFAGTISERDRNGVIEYIKAQEEHHKSQSLYDEMMDIGKSYGLSMYGADWK